VGKPLYVLSLGAGVQSSQLALGLASGEFGEPPEFAIFADTQNEGREVYEWLDHLETLLPYPIHRVTRGNLGDASTVVRESKTGTKYLKPMIPAYTLGPAGERGISMRHCTADYKIQIIQKEIRLHRDGREVVQYLGISWDEAHRMKPSQFPYVHNAYPLVEKRMTRGHCLEWMERNGYPRPPRSACIYCPYHSDEEWKRIKTETPDEFAEAVAYEKRLQSAYAALPTMSSTPYLHASRVPLESVEFTDDRQADMFGNDCAGVCGV
jgi:hypothetical protein